MKWAFGLALALAAAGAIECDAARIRGVQERMETRPAPLVSSLQGRRMPKFAEALEADICRFDVEWELDEGERGPLSVQFHYRTGPDVTAPIQVLTRNYAKVATGRRTAVFALPAGQRASAWRVRIVQDKRVLVERTSATWE